MIQSCTSFHFKERYKVIVFDMVAIFLLTAAMMLQSLFPDNIGTLLRFMVQEVHFSLLRYILTA
jgi:hypothetical protein